MELLLIRHGLAVDDAPGIGDVGRWLNSKGRKTTRRVARWIAKGKRRRPAAIWSSPLVRAMQTAEILAAETGYKGEVRACSELSPGRDPGDLLKLLTQERLDGPIALVGHEPSLSVLTKALLGDKGFDGFRKSAVLSLAWDEGVGTFRFLFDPVEMKKRKRLDGSGRSRDDSLPPSSQA